jgi:hypothetical protein
MSPNIQKSNRFLCYQSVEILANLLGYNSGFKILEKDIHEKCSYFECVFHVVPRPHNKFSPDFNKIFTIDQARVSYSRRSCFFYLNS